MTNWRERVRARRPHRWDGSSGPPRSANGASSLHLFWDSPRGEWVGAEAVFEVVEPPSVPRLYFWAMQVSFSDRGRRGGGAHLGLQWYPAHPGATAVNWGGYGPDGTELDGSVSALPSATGNVNTRDLDWEVGRRYRLRVTSTGEVGRRGLTAWRGEVFDEATGHTSVVRDLWATGNRLEDPMVWSEVFADCDASRVVVRWSSFALIAADEAHVPVRSARVNYQSLGDGGCTNTDAVVEGGAFLQITSTPRHTPQGSRLVVH